MTTEPTPAPDAQGVPNMQAVPPAPVPTLCTISAAQGSDGSSWVVLTMNTPVGVSAYWLDGDGALQIAHQLRNAGREAKSGLVVPHAASQLVVPRG